MFTVNKLKIVGFKSFAHPTELLIEEGVTGIVGPNGCGKSNIFEAIRWVMGESSSKSLRSGSMDDVIFNGTQNLPEKNFAEVSIELDDFKGNIQNLPQTEKRLVISRTLERGVGSFYKINNKDVRAKDISILFYDSGSGPRSSSIISQGNIDQIINFKPIERKIILEDAAGTSGLQARRHESELKLQSTEINLEKLEINLNNLIDQKKSLSRQARQADRYEQISENIKFYQSILIFSEWKTIINNINKSKEEINKLKEKLTSSIDLSKNQKEKINMKKNEISQEQESRDNLNKNLFETENNINSLNNKLESLKNKRAEIERFQETITKDKSLEEKRSVDLKKYILDLEKNLTKKSDNSQNKEKLQNLNLEEIQLKDELKRLEAMFVNEIQMTLGEEFQSDNLKEEKENLSKKNKHLNLELISIHKNQTDLQKNLKAYDKNLRDLDLERKSFEKKNQETIKNINDLSAQNSNLIKQLKTINEEREINSKKLTELQTEIKTLNQLIGGIELSKDSIVNLLQIKSGYQNAVYAALMNELDATLKNSPKMWLDRQLKDILPIENPLSQYVSGPKELNLILSQIGVVENPNDASQMQKKLKVGQIIVDKKGRIWRWDGFISEDNLQKKKLIDSQLRLNKLANEVDSIKKKLVILDTKIEKFQENEKQLTFNSEKEKQELEKINQILKNISLKSSSSREKKSMLEYNSEKLLEKKNELDNQQKSLITKIKSIEDKENLLKRNDNDKSKNEKEAVKKNIQVLDKKIEQNRNQINSIKEILMKEELNRTFVLNDIEKSRTRLKETEKQIEILTVRQEDYLTEEKKLNELPTQIQNKINDLQGSYNQIKNKINIGRGKFENILTQLKALEDDLSKIEHSRENQRNDITKFESILDSDNVKEKELRNLIFQSSSKQPEELEQDQKIIDSKYKDHNEINSHLEKLIFQREQMGPVNLRARLEEQELAKSIEELELEKNDLIQAIEKLRIAINKINSEGKNRLIDAFAKVNKNFAELFKKLFEGGEAKLELIKSEDPLETGLEIYARPPGKKLSSISLLSGGEKTLTAIALIFSIFLINPSPICILDEVDAALDDLNVEKFCKILEELKNNTKTKFLIITHHKITMASIDRVYGVTMAEKGISDLVSVDFEKNDFKEAV